MTWPVSTGKFSKNPSHTSSLKTSASMRWCSSCITGSKSARTSIRRTVASDLRFMIESTFAEEKIVRK